MTGRLPVLGDLLADGLGIRIWCNVCKRPARFMSARQACDLLGERTPIYGCWRTLKCRCGVKGSTPNALFAMADQLSSYPAEAELQRELLALTLARAEVIWLIARRGQIAWTRRSRP